MATASDIMTSNVVTIRQTASVREALQTLDELDVRHLPVVDDHEGLVGMLSERDLLRLRRSQDVLAQPVSEVMSGDIVMVNPATDVVEIIDLMTENRIGAVPVVDSDSQLAGIVSYVDVLRVAGRALAHEPLLTS
jgi:CBS domain-containing protein